MEYHMKSTYRYSYPHPDGALRLREHHFWRGGKRVQQAVAHWDRSAVQGVRQVEDWEVEEEQLQPFWTGNTVRNGKVRSAMKASTNIT